MATGEQIPQVSGFHVEPTVLGHGGCSNHGHCSCQWRGKTQKPTNRLQNFIYDCAVFLVVVVFWLCHQGKPPDWQDFVGIITLLVINSTISFIEENNAGNAAAALMARLAPKAKVCHRRPLCSFTVFPRKASCVCWALPKSLNWLSFLQVLRDGRWTEEDAAILVPGDIVSIKLGDIIPADARLLEGDPLKIDQVLPIANTCCKITWPLMSSSDLFPYTSLAL